MIQENNLRDSVFDLDDVGSLSFDGAYQKLQQCADMLRQGGQGFAETTAIYNYSQALADHCTALLTRVSSNEKISNHDDSGS